VSEFVLYGGKGGVGKTTCAAATALTRARTDGPTLVVSTDPAHSLSDVFDVPVGADPTRVLDAAPLWAVEVDPGERIGEYRGQVSAALDELEDLGISTYRTGTVGTNYILRDGLKPFFFRDEQFWSVPPVAPERTEDDLVRVQASRLLHEVRWCYLHPWRLKRTLRSMDDGQIAHFAFHPHDLLGYYRLDWVLDRVLGVVDDFRARDDVAAITMADLPALV